MDAQLEFDLNRNWGGRRPGAGRPRKHLRPELGGKPGVPHLKRENVPHYVPVHVTLKVRNGVGHLRAHERAQIIESALFAAKQRFGMRIVHWTIQGNHLHLIVEVAGREALARGVQAFASRVARRLNALNRRSGAVFVDRYHSELLRSPTQVKNAIRYVEENLWKHTGAFANGLPDPLSSASYSGAPEDLAPQAEPRTWLLRVGWQKGR